MAEPRMMQVPAPPPRETPSSEPSKPHWAAFLVPGFGRGYATGVRQREAGEQARLNRQLLEMQLQQGEMQMGQADQAAAKKAMADWWWAFNNQDPRARQIAGTPAFRRAIGLAPDQPFDIVEEPGKDGPVYRFYTVGESGERKPVGEPAPAQTLEQLYYSVYPKEQPEAGFGSGFGTYYKSGPQVGQRIAGVDEESGGGTFKKEYWPGEGYRWVEYMPSGETRVKGMAGPEGGLDDTLTYKVERNAESSTGWSHVAYKPDGSKQVYGEAAPPSGARGGDPWLEDYDGRVKEAANQVHKQIFPSGFLGAQASPQQVELSEKAKRLVPALAYYFDAVTAATMAIQEARAGTSPDQIWAKLAGGAGQGGPGTPMPTDPRGIINAYRGAQGAIPRPGGSAQQSAPGTGGSPQPPPQTPPAQGGGAPGGIEGGAYTARHLERELDQAPSDRQKAEVWMALPMEVRESAWPHLSPERRAEIRRVVPSPAEIPGQNVKPPPPGTFEPRLPGGIGGISGGIRG